MRPAVIRAYALGIITGSMLTAGLSMLAGPARADVGTATIDIYAEAICETLTAYPTIGGVAGVARFLMGDEGYSSGDSADIVVASVLGYCPEYLPLLKRFAAAYGPADVV